MRTPILLLAAVLLAGGGRRRRGLPEERRQALGPHRQPNRDHGRGGRRGRADLGPRVERACASRRGARPSRSTRSGPGRIAAGDADGWVALGEWADARGLGTQAREAYNRALAASPDDPRANEALGNVQMGGRWVSEDESYKARGYVQYEGEWITPAEHEAILRERAAEDARDRERREAESRAREAEARAAEAEANGPERPRRSRRARASRSGTAGGRAPPTGRRDRSSGRPSPARPAGRGRPVPR